MFEFIEKLFSSSGFMPHGHCYLWEPGVLWTHVAGDILTSLSYFLIPIGLWIFVSKRKDLQFKGIFLLFATFILACGISHLFDIWTIWVPTYRVESVIKLSTGLISFITAIAFFRLIPEALRIPSSQMLEKTKVALEQVNRTLEAKVDSRTMQLNYYSSSLEELLEIANRSYDSLNEMLTKYLTVGCRLLNMETGIISGITDDVYTIQSIVSPNQNWKKGDTFELKDTLCDFVVKRNETIYYPNLAEANVQEHPVYKMGQLQSYIGVALKREGKLFGTLNFTSAHSPNEDKGESIIKIVELMAQQIVNLMVLMEAKAELKISQEEYKDLYDHAPEMMASVDLKTGLLANVNDTMVKKMGYSKNELTGKHILTIYHPDSKEKAKKLLKKLKENGSLVNEKLMLQSKNEDLIHIELTAKLVLDDSGNPSHSSSILRDVTVQNQLQKSLVKSKSRFQVIASLSPVGIYENDLTGACIYVNEATSKIVGVPMEECFGNGWGVHIHPDDRERAFGNWQKMVNHGTPYLEEIRFVHPDGKLVWAITEARIIKNELGEKTGFMGSIIDVTKQKQNQKQLERNNEELNKKQWLLEIGEQSAKMGTMIWDTKTDELEYSKEMVNIFGFEPQEVNPQNFQEKAFRRTHPDDIQGMLDSMEFARKSLEPTIHDNRIILPDNAERWLRTRSYWMPEISKMVVSVQDVTIEKEQMALQILNENLASINEELRVTSEQLIEANITLENQAIILNRGETVAQLGSFIYNRDAKEFECTNGFKNVFGISKEKTDGMNILQLTYDRILPEFKKEAKEIFFMPIESEVAAEASFQILLPNQEIRWIRGVSQLLKDRIEGIVQDITVTKQAQTSLEEANKKEKEANEELEQFVYSVSHDLRAPIRHVEGYAEWLAEDSETFTEKQNQNLGKIIQSSNRLGVMIDELLDYSRTRKLPLKKINIDLNKLVLESIDLFVKETQERSIEWQVGDLPTVYADLSMMKIVFDNLLSNAVKYSSREAHPMIQISAETRKNDFLIKIADNGVGFNMEYKNKLFAIFQRLHKRSEFGGTGIGLANVYRIISRHKGEIWAEGIVNVGATFYFTIPRILNVT